MRFFPIVIGLTVVSIFQMFIVTVQNPLTTDGPVLKMLAGEVPDGFVSWLATSPIWYSVEELCSGHYARNLGELLGLYGPMSLMPLVFMFAAAHAVLFLLWRQARGYGQDQAAHLGAWSG